MEPHWLSILPPVTAIILAIWSRQVLVSLFAGIWMGWTILANGNAVIGLRDALEACVNVFKDGGNTKVIIFSAMVGALIALTQRSGGVTGFIDWIFNKDLVKGRKSAGVGTWITGIVVFVESSITSLVVGSIFRPIFDRLHISREKLAYFCDSTAAPVCILIPINGWGAYIMGLLSKQGIDGAFVVLLKSIVFNWYAILALAMVLFVILFDFNIGPMAAAEKRTKEGKLADDDATPLVSDDVLSLNAKENVTPRARNMLWPIATMVIMMPVGLWITGSATLQQQGLFAEASFFDVLSKGSGSTSVFWAVLAAISVAGIMYYVQGIMKVEEIMSLVVKGMGGLMPLAILMVFAFAIGATCKELQTGKYVSEVAKQWLSPKLIPLVLFGVSAFIAFSTGTSWGTFAIMIPIAIPLVETMGANIHLVLGAVLSGGIFGDHCSPISDTTIISSMASGCDHIAHVKTQLPYALLTGAIASFIYLLLGLFFS
ncbi:Na+/H+ antiporter NhaC family protein [Candidatus Uabimicrobium amorphum]|uniref:Sodium:proton antiporter n=1 Tax=Uabimicrobium amorphum TaxID=2596890 RepID=A0A5S9IQE8_UABAM|nr:Na+/H+ antiporter NhaC family protein [Candidatus Uabimicrobium amorphum]BBM85552.1 sodium:proton antiporter [Candidatus Uabimicrobium amorphum]